MTGWDAQRLEPEESPRAARRRIAITGVGLVTPLGMTREETWQGILAGQRAVAWLDDEIPTPSSKHPFSRPFGARVPGYATTADRMAAFATQAAREAVAHAGLSAEALREAACVLGTSKIDLQHFDRWMQSFHEPADADPRMDLLYPSCSAVAVAQDLGCEAAVLCPVAACATGLVSIIQAANLIRSGHCPIAMAGSTDASLHPGLLASYRRLGVLAHPGDDPSLACRPFDRNRTGFAVGEGAGVLVLEDWEHATQRNAPIVAEWIDGILGSDPTGLTRIDPEGKNVAEFIQRLLTRCGLTQDQVDGVNLHATATELNDQAEGAALQKVFGNRTDPLPAFGIKGAIGHLMGAAGAVETAICAISLNRQFLPPTVNHTEPEPEFANFMSCAPESRAVDLQHILKISLGFGGTIAAGVLKRVDELT